METLTQIFKFKRYLKAHAGITVHVQDYCPAKTQVEGSGTFHYPETIEIKIENWSNHWFSIRMSDSRCIGEGGNLNGKGQTIGQVYRMMRRESRDFELHKSRIKSS